LTNGNEKQPSTDFTKALLYMVTSIVARPLNIYLTVKI